MSKIRQFLEQYNFDTDTIIYLDTAYQQLVQNHIAYSVFLSQIKIYKDNINFDYHPVFNELHALEEITGLHKYTIDLLFIICLMPFLKEHYSEYSIEDRYFHGLISNLKAYIRHCENLYGICGTYIGWWLVAFFRMKCFSIGSLQYKLRELSEDTIWGNYSLHAGDRYLDVHIPPGTSLSSEHCHASYAEAAIFFRKHYGLDKIFITCHSWLLSPDLKTLLPEQSNILAFSKDYSIIKANTVPLSHIVHYIFGITTVPNNLDDLPESTSLQRAYKRHLKSGNPLHTAFGIMLWE